jgi:molybdopterin-biosynthesis enzyme MoeA-like protein
MEGIARGLGRKVVQQAELEEILRKRYGDAVNKASLKLAAVPEGAGLLTAGGLQFPVIFVDNIFIFPGIPKAAQRKFSAIKSRFRDAPFLIRKVYLKAREEEIAHHLDSILRAFPRLLLGSYPATESADHHVTLTLESKDQTYLESAFRQLIDLLPEDRIVKLE